MAKQCIMFQENIEKRYKVSVAMAVYNGEHYLAEQLDSILCQLRYDDELVVSVDSSKDGTMDILERYASLDHRIKVYKNPYSPGVVHNFQNALEHTIGDIIFYSDQDDVWMNNKIEKVLECFDDKLVTVVIHDTSLVDENLNIISPSTFKLRGGVRTSVLGNYIRLSYIGCAMAFRAKYKSVVLPIPTIYRSHDWWTGLICTMGGGKMVAIKECLIYHRIHSLNVTPKTRPSVYYQIQTRWILLFNMLKRYRKRISIKLKLKLVWKSMSPICYLGDSILVCYKYGIFYIYDISTCKLVKKIRTSFSFWEYLVARVKCINRFFRLGVRCAIPLSSSSFVYYCQNRIYEMDIETGKVSDAVMITKGVRPLKFTEVKGIKSFVDGVYFGGYLSNPNKNSVSIYRT